MGSILLFLLVIIVGYLCGSVCSAIIVSRVFALPDPCSSGSKNPGATNVLRLAGKKYAAIVLLGDMLKGLIPVVFATLLGAKPATLGFTCLAAVIGHMYPIFFNFKGGKGVATAIGALLGLHFLMGVGVIATWLLVANFSRYSSLASIVSLVLAPLYSIVCLGSSDAFPPLLIITILTLYKHRHNISRLIDGEETKIQFQPNQLADIANELMQEKQTTAAPQKTVAEVETKEEVESNTVKPGTDIPSNATAANQTEIIEPGVVKPEPSISSKLVDDEDNPKSNQNSTQRSPD